jgi:hypothetical protein
VHASAREADKPNGPVDIGIGGARGPGKTHAVFAQCTLDDAQRVDGLKGLFLRKTGKSAKESLDDLVVKVLANKIDYEYTNSAIKFKNGSRVIMGGFKDDKDIDNYVGQEYDFIAVEEGNQLTKEKKEMLRGSLRTSKSNWRPRWYETFNPGGVGHGDVKERYVLPYRYGIAKRTRFIPATYKDNPNLNVEYVDYLEGLDGQLGQAWREGDFDIMAGMYFTEWREAIHVVEPFDIPIDWRRFIALDYGLDAPSSLGWYAVSPEKILYRYREIYERGLTYSALAEKYVSLTPHNERIEYMVADPSIWNRDGRNDLALSGAEIFERRVNELTKNSINKCPRMERGNNDRITGWGVLREHLRPYQTKDPTTGKEIIRARLQVFNTCYNFIRVMPLQIHDDNKPEDLDSDMEDHAPDEARYAVMSRPSPSYSLDDIRKREFDAMIRKKKGLDMKTRFPLFTRKR